MALRASDGGTWLVQGMVTHICDAVVMLNSELRLAEPCHRFSTILVLRHSCASVIPVNLSLSSLAVADGRMNHLIGIHNPEECQHDDPAATDGGSMAPQTTDELEGNASPHCQRDPPI